MFIMFILPSNKIPQIMKLTCVIEKSLLIKIKETANGIQ